MVKGNTLASFDAALDLGVDMIEFDVCAVRGRLGIAHNALEGRLLGAVPLEAGLAHLAADRFGDVELNVDLKQRGVEAGAVDLELSEPVLSMPGSPPKAGRFFMRGFPPACAGTVPFAGGHQTTCGRPAEPPT